MDTAEVTREYRKRIDECAKELGRDPYLALVYCSDITEDLEKDKALHKNRSALEIIRRKIDNVETQADSLWRQMIG